MHNPNREEAPDAAGVSRNRRVWARYPVCETLSIVIGSRTYGGTVIDESIGGVALTVQDVDPIETGMVVELAYGEMKQVGYVTAADEQDEREYRLAISWAPADCANKLRDYVFHGTLAVACKVVSSYGSERYKVELANGKQFTVSAQNVRPQSLDERTLALASTRARDLRIVADMYGISRRTTPSEMMDDILQFEFGGTDDHRDLSATV